MDNDKYTDEGYLEHTERIFFELASEQRLAILFKLNQGSLRLAQIARDSKCYYAGSSQKC